MRSSTIISFLATAATFATAAPLSVRQEAATTICNKVYEIVAGDVCWDIVRRLNEASDGTVYTLMNLYALNPSVNADCTNLQIGEKLCFGNGQNAAAAVVAENSSQSSVSSAEVAVASPTPEAVAASSTLEAVAASPIPEAAAYVAPAVVEPAPAPAADSGSSNTYYGEGTYFYQNGVAGHCGSVNPDSAYIVALESSMYADGSHCGKMIRVFASNGASVDAMVADSCPSCVSTQSIDLSVAAFQALASLDVGMMSVRWSFL